MSHRLEYEATLNVRDDVDPERIEFMLDDDAVVYFDEWVADKENRTLSFTGVNSAGPSIEGYLLELGGALRSIAPYIADGEDVYVIDIDAAWPTAWRYVFKDGDVKCYEGMMIFVEEVEL